jgi:hypothetical protein
VKNTLLKVRPLFCHFLGILHKIRERIFSAAGIFLGPLLCFVAEISAGWQHCFCVWIIGAGHSFSYCDNWRWLLTIFLNKKKITIKMCSYRLHIVTCVNKWWLICRQKWIKLYNFTIYQKVKHIMIFLYYNHANKMRVLFYRKIWSIFGFCKII